MSDLPAAALEFAAASGWGAAAAAALAGDASGRRYWRLSQGCRTAVLMAAPDNLPGTRAFVSVGAELAARGLESPAILADGSDRGLLLLEDLGDGNVAALLERDAGAETEIYAAAIDVLVQLQRDPPPPWLERYDAAAMTDAATLARSHYAHATPAQWAPAATALAAVLERTAADASVLVHRDFHAGNLVWRPDRAGLGRLGLLDFQDALSGHPAYDLVSLLRDARRDVSAGVEAAAIARFLDATGRAPGPFRAACAAQGAQRQLRILGVCGRLAAAGRTGYLTLLPRVWRHLQRDLSHPDLADLRGALADVLPAPDAAQLARLAA